MILIVAKGFSETTQQHFPKIVFFLEIYLAWFNKIVLFLKLIQQENLKKKKSKKKALNIEKKKNKNKNQKKYDKSSRSTNKKIYLNKESQNKRN